MISDYNKLREFLAEIEHQQWEHWSKELCRDLKRWQEYSDIMTIKVGIERRLMSWEKFWKPYKDLPEDAKDSDREWADKIIDNVPFKCPVYQCGGLMKAKERPYPKGKTEDDFPDGMAGDSQLPDLVCSNCGAIYRFQRFKNARKKD